MKQPILDAQPVKDAELVILRSVPLHDQHGRRYSVWHVKSKIVFWLTRNGKNWRKLVLSGGSKL